MSAREVRTLVVDDEKPARTRLLRLMRDHEELTVVGVGTNGLEAVSLIRELRPQLMFLDVDMPDLDGFGVLRAIPKPLLPATVFVTAYDKFAIAAFEARAVDYLLKPFGDDRFEAALAHAMTSLRGETIDEGLSSVARSPFEPPLEPDREGPLDRVVVRTQGRIVLVSARDIDWISAAGVYLELHVGTATYLYRSGLAAFLQRLAPRMFIRIHRSIAVNAERVAELRSKGHGDYGVVLKNGRELTLSRAHRGELESWLGQPL
jgi:two-component system LytT family response regulator